MEPRGEESYSNRSSGVVLESIFLGNIVIGPKFLLRQLGIAGIEYDSIDELQQIDLAKVTAGKIDAIKKNNKKLCEKYGYENVRATYINSLQHC